MEERYQCYYVDENGDRCENVTNDCWCSPEHKDLEQRARYGDRRPRGQRNLSVEQMQEGFKEMAERARIRKMMQKDGQLKFE